MSKFLDSICAHTTSEEIMQAILTISGGFDEMAYDIWEFPSQEDLLAVWEIVTNNGVEEADQYFWDSPNNDWNLYLEANN